MSEEVKQPDRMSWTIPHVWPYSADSNPNPRNERLWVRELSEQVEYLTAQLDKALRRVSDLEPSSSSTIAPNTAKKVTKKAPQKQEAPSE